MASLTKILRNIGIASIILVLFFMALPYVFSIWAMFIVERNLDLPPVDCTSEIDVSFCKEKWMEDGYVRYSLQKNLRHNCCIAERTYPKENTVYYKLMVCSPDAEIILNCTNLNLFGVNRWIVDNQELYVDFSWEETQKFNLILPGDPDYE